MNFILIAFSFLSTSLIIYGSILNLFENKIPAVFLKIFRYGKFAYRGNISGIASKLVIEVPKSWFKHFYCLAVLVYTYVLYEVTAVYIFKQNPSQWFHNILNVLCGDVRTSYTSATKVYITLLLLSLQVIRRFYDTHFVSVFAKNSYMNLSQYLIGLLHYPGAALAIICEAPKFAQISFYTAEINLLDLSWRDIFAIFLFIWAWFHQQKTSKILANLRKNKKGDVVTDDHRVPNGDWFKYLSAPHQTAEILMYFSITILLWYNVTWFFVFIWVLSNQIETILLTHWWYKETFDNFPKDRKALVPFLY